MPKMLKRSLRRYMSMRTVWQREYERLPLERRYPDSRVRKPYHWYLEQEY